MSTDVDLSVLRESTAKSTAGRPRSPDLTFTFDQTLFVIDPQSAQAESFRALRTQLVAKHVDDGRRALAVCGASQGVGCSFVAANLAISLSQIGIRTLLIDGDLRRPSISQLIKTNEPTAGLAECLTSSNSYFNDFIQSEVRSNFSIIPSTQTQNPQELLAMPRFRELLDFCLREYDMTIIDTPPANNSSDSRLIASLIGYCLMVARRDKSFVADLSTLSAELKMAGVQVVGSVLNEA
jgi:capsular exopolysaccharide synthesis family protein